MTVPSTRSRPGAWSSATSSAHRLKLGLTANSCTRTRIAAHNNEQGGVSEYFVLSATPNFVDLRRRRRYPANLFVNANPLQTVQLSRTARS